MQFCGETPVNSLGKWAKMNVEDLLPYSSHVSGRSHLQDKQANMNVVKNVNL